MFDHTHYVPILRWKGAEKNAVKQLTDEEKNRMTPLFELPPPRLPSSEKDKPKTTDQLIAQMAGEIFKNWGSKPAFVDLHLIDPAYHLKGLDKIFSDARVLKIRLIPVTTLRQTHDFQSRISSIANDDQAGICLRLSRMDFQDSALLVKLEEMKTFFKLDETVIDLLFDFKITDQDCENLKSTINKFPNISKWRTFSIASGAFPVDLRDFEVGMNFCPRLDWNAWSRQIKGDGLARRPSYSDYTIQHPIYPEPRRRFNVSASIRYALQEQWLIMRGQAFNAKGSTGSAQYPAHAQLLSKHKGYCGKDFSLGDAYIYEKGSDIKTGKPGSTTTWLTAGINHHLVLTIRQIANLYGTTTSA